MIGPSALEIQRILSWSSFRTTRHPLGYIWFKTILFVFPNKKTTSGIVKISAAKKAIQIIQRFPVLDKSTAKPIGNATCRMTVTYILYPPFPNA